MQNGTNNAATINAANAPKIIGHGGILSRTEKGIIGQFNHGEIKRIAGEIIRQRNSAADYVFPAGKLTVDEGGKLVLGGVKSFKVGTSMFTEWDAAEKASDECGERVQVMDGTGAFPLNRNAERQLANRVGVPVDFIDRLKNDGDMPLLANVLSTRLARTSPTAPRNERLLVRTLDGRARAILSDEYRILSNDDLFFAAADKLEKVGGEVWQMRLTDDSFQMLAVAKGISGKVTLDRTFDFDNSGWQRRWNNADEDIQFAALSVGNSETGRGGLGIAPAVMTDVCCNFNVWAKTLRQIHIGRSRDEDGLVTSDASRHYENLAVWAKVQQAIDTVFDRERFAKYIETLNGATQQNIAPDKVERVVDRMSVKYDLSKDRRDAILRTLLEGGDYTRYGLSQSVTFQAHRADLDGNADDARELEIVGGDLIHCGKGEYAELVA